MKIRRVHTSWKIPSAKQQMRLFISQYLGVNTECTDAFIVHDSDGMGRPMYSHIPDPGPRGVLRVPGQDITVVDTIIIATTNMDHTIHPSGPEAGPSREEGGGVEGPGRHGVRREGHRLAAGQDLRISIPSNHQQDLGTGVEEKAGEKEGWRI